MKLYNYLIIFITLLLLFIYFEFNTEYKTINEVPKLLKVPNLSKLGTLFIGTHNFEHKDIFITMKEFQKYDDKFYMLFANKVWNYLLEPFRPKNIEFIYVKEKTVEKISSKLLLGQNVIMFLYKESESTGPFYMLKNTNSPLILFKIKKQQNNENNQEKYQEKVYNHYNSSFIDIVLNNFMSKFTLELKEEKYQLYKNFQNDNNKLFIEELKKEMYS